MLQSLGPRQDFGKAVFFSRSTLSNTFICYQCIWIHLLLFAPLECWRCRWILTLFHFPSGHMLGSDACGHQKEKQRSQIVVFSEELIPGFKALNGELHLRYYSVPRANHILRIYRDFFFFFKDPVWIYCCHPENSSLSPF